MTDKQTIIDIAHTRDFYPLYVEMALDKWKYSLKKWGFIIYGKNYYHDKYVNIEFIWIHPEYRRKGIFTKIIQHFQKKFDIISYTSSEDSMKKFAEKENFFDGGVCRSGNENFYAWSNRYPIQYVMDNCY